MRLRKLVLLISAASVMAAGKVSALGLGEISLKSALNEPLDAEIRLLQVRDLSEEEILVGLASTADFDRVGVDKSFFLTGMKFSVDLDAANGPIIKITTNSPVREPFLNFLVESQWPSGRILREYTLLMDLPVFSAQASSQVQAPVQEQTAPVSEPVSTPAPQSSVVRTRPTTPAAASYAGQTFGPVSANDTLWGIALKVRPSSQFSAQQTMIAIQRLNPDAFINGNINLLRKGQVLRIPTAEQINELNFNQAVSEVAFQNDQWDIGSSTKATLVSDSQNAAAPQAQPTGGRVRLGAANDADIASQTSSGVGAESDSRDALQNELGGALEELDTAKRENSELRDKIADLEAQIDTMERLVEVSSAELRALQVTSEQQAQKQASADDAAPVNDTAAETFNDASQTPLLGDNETQDPSEVATQEAELQASTQAETDGGQSSDETDAAESSTTSARTQPDNRTVVTTTQSKDPSLFDSIMDNIVLWAAVLIALLAAAFVFAKKFFGAKEDELEDTFNPFEEEPIEPSQIDEPVIEDLEQKIEEFTEDDIELDLDLDQSEPEPAVAATDDSDSVPVVPEEVIAEADIYIAYGKYEQAEEMLEKALQVDPNNNDVRMKLLEVHADSNNLERFDNTLSQLQNTGDQETISRGINLRESFADAAPFVAGAAVAGVGAFAAKALNSDEVLDDDEITHRDLSQEFADLDELSQPEEPSDSFDEFDFDLDPEFDSAEEGANSDPIAAELDDPISTTSPDAVDPLEEIDVTIQRKLSDLEREAIAQQVDDSPEVTDQVVGSIQSPDAEDLSVQVLANEFDTLDDALESELGIELDDDHSESLELDIESEDALTEVDLPVDEDTLDEFNTEEINSLVADADLIEDDTLSELTDLAPDALMTQPDSGLEGSNNEITFDALLPEDLDAATEQATDSLLETSDKLSQNANEPIESLEFDDGLDLHFGDGDFDEAGLDVIDGELEVAGTKYDNLESTDDSLDDVDLELDISDLEDELPANDSLSLADHAMNDAAELDLPEPELDMDLAGDTIASFMDTDQSDDTITSFSVNDEPEPLADSDLQALDDEMDALASDVSLAELPTASEQPVTIELEQENFNSDDVFAEVLASTEQDLGDITPDDDIAAADDFDDSLDFLADTDESDTKLDLARAYIDMGDGDGARDILSEVITDGNDQQKEEAQTLMDKIPG